MTIKRRPEGGAERFHGEVRDVLFAGRKAVEPGDDHRGLHAERPGDRLPDETLGEDRPRRQGGGAALRLETRRGDPLPCHAERETQDIATHGVRHLGHVRCVLERPQMTGIREVVTRGG